jgi:predicted DNA-binding transcriptional regulator YafY
MTKTALLLDMIDRLRNRPGITIRELADQLERSERTIYRWLNELSVDVGASVYCDQGGYYLGKNGDSPLNLTAEELVALRMSLKSTPFAEGSRIGEQARSAWLKIRQASSGDRLAAAADIASGYSVSFNAPEGSTDPTVAAKLEDGIARRKRLRIVYRSQKSNAVKDYTVDPYALVFRRHSWYLLAHCQEHGRVVQFKLVRFQRITETEHVFDPPKGFSAEDHFQHSWEAWGGGEPVDVRVRFSPRVAMMVAESKRHPSQRTCAQQDGSLIFEAKVSGIEEIAIWILGYGGEAEVLEPPELRRYVADHAAAMAETYARQADGD